MNSTPTAIVSEHAKSTLSVQAELLLVVIIIDLIFGSFITIGNASLFTTIYRDPCRCLCTPSVFLIANLSIADFFMGIISYLRAGELTYKYCGLGDLPILNITCRTLHRSCVDLGCCIHAFGDVLRSVYCSY